jgi:hypothetical protein
MTTEAEHLLKIEQQSLEEKKEDYHFSFVSEKKGDISPEDRKFAEKVLRNLISRTSLKHASVLVYPQK